MGVPSTRSTIVVDAILAVWAIVPVAAPVDAIGLFAGWHREGLRVVAPALWLAECASAVRRSVYAGALSEEEGRTSLEDLFALEVEILPVTLQQTRSAFEWAERLRQAQAYDGFYLALAQELRAELWTGDRRLAHGAQQAGVGWVHAV
ncbi:MAG: type II toxin-antitoxin system VapC family toxin [Chloroflexi bacterium]|nr:type II toxin-antitoxin system VapC family toxin [Chloroflexota bacterium]